jgi:hypothetical protein
MAAHRCFLGTAALASCLTGCLLYEDRDDPEWQVDAAPFPDARLIDAPTDAPPIPIDAGIDSPLAGPMFEILSPTDGTLVTHHDLVRIDARVTGNPIAGFDLTVDNIATPGALQVSGLPVGGDCFAGCKIIFSWDADAMREGTHTVQIDARDDAGTRASDSVMIRFEDAPQILFVRPTTESRGAATTSIRATIIDRGPGGMNATLSIDGTAVQSATFADCISGCTMTRVWDTSTIAAGVHTLSITATDGAGHTTTTQQSVTIADIPYVSQINVVEDDGIGALEIEVHLYDAATSEWLGCSGQSHGLQNVDNSNVLYTVNGWFSDALDRPVGVDQLAGRQLRIRVIEDDLNPCPFAPGSADDMVGESGIINAASLPNLSTSFGDTLQLTMRTGRFLSR